MCESLGLAQQQNESVYSQDATFASLFSEYTFTAFSSLEECFKYAQLPDYSEVTSFATKEQTYRFVTLLPKLLFHKYLQTCNCFPKSTEYL